MRLALLEGRISMFGNYSWILVPFFRSIPLLFLPRRKKNVEQIGYCINKGRKNKHDPPLDDWSLLEAKFEKKNAEIKHENEKW